MCRQHAGGVGLADALDDDTLLAVALADAVRSVGRRLGSEPRLVQAMVIDALGTRTRSRRAEVDASVLAAEEGVPALLAEGDSMTAEMRLRARGLDAEVTEFAIDVWRYALGLLAEDVEPPSLRHRPDRTADSTITDRVDDALLDASLLVSDDVARAGAPSFVLQLSGIPCGGALGFTYVAATDAGGAGSIGTGVQTKAPRWTQSGRAEVCLDLTDVLGKHAHGTLTITLSCSAGHVSTSATHERHD